MTSTDSTTSTDEQTVLSYEKGTWQDKMNKSATLLDRSTKARKQASNLLWEGAQTGIEEWLPTATTDTGAEGLYSEVLTILGTPRKGDASKIKTVALAVRNNGLVLASYPNLSKAYAEATRLTKTVAAQAEEDNAAEKAVESIEAPKTASTPESAALVLLSKGIDGAVVAILDALGASNFEAHRSFVRAVSTEVAARVQAAKPKPAPKVTTPKVGATKATTGEVAVKAKPASTKAKPVPTSATKGDPNKRVLPTPNAAKAKPAQNQSKGEPVSEPVHVGDDTPDEAPAPARKRAVPVKRAARV